MVNTIQVDKKSPVPIYHQIKEQLRKKIQSGELKPFQRLPSEPKMVQSHNISPMTVRQAYAELVNEGLVFREQGKGTFVAELKEKPTEKGLVMAKSLGLLIPNIAEDVYPEITRGMEDVAHERGYSVIICNTDHKAEKQIQYIRRMDEQKVAGIIIIPTAWEPMAVEHYVQLQKDGVPFVFINRFIPELKKLVDHVVSDNILGAYEAVTYLIKLGHRRIAYISGPTYIVVEERLNGYKKALAEHDIAFDESLVRLAKTREEKPGYKYMKELLQLDNPPTAVFAFNDRVAKEVYELLTELEIRVPDDMAIVGYDNSTIAISLRVPLTTVAYPSYETGALATRILIDRIEGKRNEIQYHVLKSKLVIRESCGAKLKNGGVSFVKNGIL